ncbi:MAG: bifunctional acetate--CoA ligase family protein/GNAT family N-acetyltransferase [Fimbriimonadaceae bacterium]|nr:bifunctional acetate--CoA ligase family protein/GNAT family N-acetyltransferase [Fimbriimonadaceae bacterium]
MSILNLDRIFKPQRIAVIGASDHPNTVGYSLLRNLIGAGFEGVVYPVNKKRESVQGIHAYPSVADLPKAPDLAIIATPAATVPDLVRECGNAGIMGVIVISAGFKEVGAEGKQLEEQLRAAWKSFPGMRIIGPNCLGVIVPKAHLNASFAAGNPREGHIGFVSQSGALCTSVLDWAIAEGIGFSHFVSLGNSMDVGFGDLIDYFGEDRNNHSAILYIESLFNARSFMSAARAYSRNRPIVAYKAGRFAESAAAAASHTGAMAGEDSVFDAAFQRAGIVRVFDIADIFDCAELLGRKRQVRGPNLAIVTNAGGPGVMATDTLLSLNGKLATLHEDTLEKLNAALPPAWSHGNPVDVLGDSGPERFGDAVQEVLADPGVDAVLAVLSPQAVTDPTKTAQNLAAVTADASKPVLAAWMGGNMMAGGIQLLNQAGVPTYTTPEQGVRAFMNLYSYGRNQEILHETPREIPMEFSLDRRRLRDLFDIILMEGQEILSETVSKALLEAYEIPVTKPMAARSEDEAAENARRIGFPVVLKVLSPQITHKTDVGGVVLDLPDEASVRAAYRQIVEQAKAARPDADVQGVTVQAMVRAQDGIELIVGAKKDATFGAVIMVGTGGIAAEVMRDRVLGLPPLNESLARRMLESLKSWPLLEGYRGRPGVHLDRLIEALMRFSYLIADYPEIKEIDINPLVATPEGVLALDARVVIDRDLVGTPIRKYSHLAIAPYPDEWVRKTKLSDGTHVLLRPIKPEDEPNWHEMLAKASQESLRFRFRYLFKGTTHEMAARYCTIDYDREMAIIAEIGEDDEREMIGVGRMVADPDLKTAEYAAFVVDEWQGKGLGIQFTQYLEEIGRRWGIERLVAETSTDNLAMQATFRKCGYTLEHRMEDNVVMATKDLRETAVAT